MAEADREEVGACLRMCSCHHSSDCFDEPRCRPSFKAIPHRPDDLYRRPTSGRRGFSIKSDVTLLLRKICWNRGVSSSKDRTNSSESTTCGCLAMEPLIVPYRAAGFCRRCFHLPRRLQGVLSTCNPDHGPTPVLPP